MLNLRKIKYFCRIYCKNNKEMELKDYKTRIKIKAEPAVVYAAITNPDTIEVWSGYRTEMPKEAGGEFSMWDGDICGRIIEYEQDKRVVQEWYFGEQNAPSIVTINIFPYRQAVQIELIHTNIPEDAFDNIVEGWEEYYLKTLKGFLEEE